MKKQIKSSGYDDYKLFSVVVSDGEDDCSFDILVPPETEVSDFCFEVENFCMYNMD